jgi:PAS domain S-box-containing protein
MAHDVTERRRAELALRSSEQRYRQLFEKNVAGVAICSAAGQVLDCNDAWARILGYERAEEVRGRQTKDFYFNLAEREPLLDELGREGAFFSREIQLRRKDDTRVWVLFNCVTLSIEKGVRVVRSTAIDITARKQAEEALRQREEDYRHFVAQSSEGIFRQDFDAPIPVDLPEAQLVGRILHDSYMAECNDAMATMYGLTAQDFVGKRLTETLDPDDPRNLELTREYVRSGFRVVDRESHESDAHGNPKVFRNSMIGIVKNGLLLRTWGIQRDVTEHLRAEEGRRKAEDALRESEERFRVALKDSPITVFNQDRDLRYTWIYNSQLYWQQEIIGKTDDEIIGPEKAAQLDRIKRRVLKTGIALREEVLMHHDGKNQAFDITIEPLFDADRKVIGITGATMNIGRLRERADRLQTARDKLVQAKSYLEHEIQVELGFEEIIGQSPALREVLKQARVVAPTDASVLLLGETGTGKELVARAIHALSGRREMNFIKLNCAAVPSGLLESELFGHEKGAFTGAVSQKAGRIELADKGTLFLDEIGELPLELQPKLLRVLQDREFERLGGVHTLRVDVRIVAATNRDLKREVADKEFREDLFYRLNVFPLRLPALRERRSDIPPLIEHFVRKHALRMNKHIDTIPDETVAVLQNWNWPGNIRELENLLERMIILSKGRVLAPPPAELTAPPEPQDDNLTEMEREHIIRILRETNGMLSGPDGAASRLGIKRTTLQSMLKRFNIDLRDYRRGTGTFGPD